MNTSMPVANRFDSCPRCREDADGLTQLKKLFEDPSTSSADLISYLKQTTIPNDVIEEFLALPATDKKVVQYVYKTGLYALSCMDCDMSPDRQDYMYSAVFEASLNVGELDSLTLKTMSMELCREAKDTLEEFKSNEWYVSFPLAQILNDYDVFHQFASDPEFQEVDRKRLGNALSTLLKFEEHWDDDGECLSGDAGVAVFDNVKFALAILGKPTRKAKAARSKGRNLKRKSTTAVVDEFTRLASSKSVDNRTLAALDESISLKWLKVLSKDKSESVRNAIAGNAKATHDILKVLARDRSEYVVEAVASNPSTPIDTLKTLASANSEDIRYSVACNEQVQVQILRVLGKDDSVSVRSAVARHENTPKRLLIGLARDTDEYVRQGVAQNPQAPTEVLETLSREEVSIIRACVASNPSTPIRILRGLWSDEDEYVRQCVAGNALISKDFLLEILDESQQLKRNRATYVSAIAGNPKTPVDVLVALSQDKVKW